MQHPLVLHHFDQSPFSEKNRVILGFKLLAWKSVRISRVMPRPDLMPLTGGYRRTPTMQIGADIYCDTQIIIRELEAGFRRRRCFQRAILASPGHSACGRTARFSEHSQPRVRYSGGEGASGFHRRSRAAARGQVRYRGHEGCHPQMRDQFRTHLAGSRHS